VGGVPQFLQALVYGLGAVLLIAGVFSLAQALLARLYREPLITEDPAEDEVRAAARRP
jgi:hypothetical protein